MPILPDSSHLSGQSPPQSRGLRALEILVWNLQFSRIIGFPHTHPPSARPLHESSLFTQCYFCAIMTVTVALGESSRTAAVRVFSPVLGEDLFLPASVF